MTSTLVVSDSTPVTVTQPEKTVTVTAPALGAASTCNIAKEDDEATYPTYWHSHVPPQTVEYIEKLSKEEILSLKELKFPGDNVRKTVFESLYAVSGPRTWLDHIESIPDDHQYPLTKFAQRTIHSHQNPTDCSNKKFFRVGHAARQGLGSALHVLAEALGYAMYYDRILLTHPEWPPLMDFVDRDNCQNGDPFECVWERISSCDSYANEQNTVEIGSFKEHRDFPKPALGLTAPYLGRAMQEAFPGITTNALKLWSRSQGVAYVNRLRPAALALLTQSRLDKKMHSAFSGPPENFSTLDFPFPLPRDVWSMHIRHGDKASEMTLLPVEDYVMAAERYSMMNPISSRKWAFVSSEDPTVFDEMKDIVSIKKTHTVSNYEWNWFMSNINRKNDGPLQQLQLFPNRTETTLSWLLEAFTAIECDGFIGTRNSNWNRIIDELRGTWGMSGKAPYLEVASYGEWVNYFW